MRLAVLLPALVMAPVALLAHGILASAYEITHCLIDSVGDTHHGQVARAGQLGQQQGIAPICLHPVAAGSGDRRGRDYLAVQALRTEVAPDDEAAGAGLVDDVQGLTAAE